MVLLPSPARDEASIIADDLLEAACWAEKRGQGERAARLLRLRERWLGQRYSALLRLRVSQETSPLSSSP